MRKRRNHLFFFALLVSVTAMYFGCSQPDDIITAVTKTDLYLNARLLPTNPQGMVYELWVANSQDTISLGKFGYDQNLLKYYNENGTERADSNHFEVEGDIFNYTHLFVSIETSPDDNLNVPGPIMLIDEVTDPSDDMINLRFPLNDSLTTAFVAFNMETTSDEDRDLYDGFGIWFSSYMEKRDSVRDTVRLDSFVVRYKQDSTLPMGSTSWYFVDTANVTVLETIRVYGLDPLLYDIGLDSSWDTVVRFDSVLEMDTTWPYTVVDNTKDSTVFYYTIRPDTSVGADTFHYDYFFQSNYGLPNYSSYGWHYKGWVVSPTVPKEAVGEITPPAYPINYNAFDSLIPGIEGGLLTTGTFDDIAAPDDSNPYVLGPRIPPFPGEDFLQNLPDGMTGWQGLVPYTTGNSGTVFITLEPDNFVTDTTNFPLFVMIGKIPKTQDELVDLADDVDVEMFGMENKTETNNVPVEGFPSIIVNIKRH